MHTSNTMRRLAVMLFTGAALLLCITQGSISREWGGAHRLQNEDDEKMGPLRGLDAWKGFAYLSGHYQTLHNHPAVYADSASKKFVVIGTGYRKEFPFKKGADAMKAYRKLLLDRSYEPDGQRKRQDEFAMFDFSGELSDSVKRHFTKAQLDQFGDVAPAVGYRYFSGHTGSYPNHPTIYAHGTGFTIVARGVEMEMSMREAKKAFTTYLDVVKSAGVMGK